MQKVNVWIDQEAGEEVRVTLLKKDIGQRKKRWNSSSRKKQNFGNLRFVDRGKESVIKKAKAASENGDNWDKILEETWEDRIPGTDREVASGEQTRSMSFSVMRGKWRNLNG